MPEVTFVAICMECEESWSGENADEEANQHGLDTAHRVAINEGRYSHLADESEDIWIEEDGSINFHAENGQIILTETIGGRYKGRICAITPDEALELYYELERAMENANDQSQH